MEPRALPPSPPLYRSFLVNEDKRSISPNRLSGSTPTFQFANVSFSLSIFLSHSFLSLPLLHKGADGTALTSQVCREGQEGCT